MARKTARSLRGALTALIACAAVALCAASPARADERADELIVTVPTRIECALRADGGVVAPGGIEIENESAHEAFYVTASTVEDFGHDVDFDMALGGESLLSRADGEDTSREVELGESASEPLGLSVEKLTRARHAALMDAAARGEAPLLTVGFDFTRKSLLGSVSIAGEAKLGETLTASVSGTQDDARIAYRWYRDGLPVAGATSAQYTTVEADVGKTVKCEAYDAGGRYVGAITAQVGPIKGPEAFAVFSADDGSLNFYKRFDVPEAGSQFEGKAVTGIYRDFENKEFDQAFTGTNTCVPWADVCSRVTNVTFVDAIRPKSMAWWFHAMRNLTSVDFSKLDTSECVSFKRLFSCSPKVEKFDGMNDLDTSSLKNVVACFDGTGITDNSMCADWNVSNVEHWGAMFYNTRKLRSFDASNWTVEKAYASSPGVSPHLFSGNLRFSPLNRLRVSESASRLLSPIIFFDTAKSDIGEADGYWYDEATDYAYLPSSIPRGKAATYVAVNPVEAPTVTIEGSAVYGTKLVAKVSGQPSGTTATTYQWQYQSYIDGTWHDTTLPGAKTNTMTLTTNSGGASCEGQTYRCVVTTTADPKRVPQGVSTAVGPVVKLNLTGSVRISGTPAVGETLKAEVTGAQNDAQLKYQWYRTGAMSQHVLFDENIALSKHRYTVHAPIDNYLVTFKNFDMISAGSVDYIHMYYDYSGPAVGWNDYSDPYWHLTDGLVLPKKGDYTLIISSAPGNAVPDGAGVEYADMVLPGQGDAEPIPGAMGPDYTLTETDLAARVSCRVTDGSGKYLGEIASDAVGPVVKFEAFAVFSADDGSLNFYKRDSVPAAGSQFEGKTATEVYTGIETSHYTIRDLPPWEARGGSIASCAVVDEIRPVSTAYWFAYSNLSSFSGTNLNTSNVKDMSGMFYSCESLTKLDLSDFDTSSVRDMNNMFYDCYRLKSLDLSDFDTSSVRDMSYMFMDCIRLTTLDLFNFNTHTVTDMACMFDGCSYLTTLNLSSFDTSSVTDMSNMFQFCGKLTMLDLSSFDTSSVRDMINMFYDCSELQCVKFGNRFAFKGYGGYLPEQSPRFIPGADGRWYSITDGKGYAPEDVPSNKADTYVASRNLLPPAETETIGPAPSADAGASDGAASGPRVAAAEGRTGKGQKEVPDREPDQAAGDSGTEAGRGGVAAGIADASTAGIPEMSDGKPASARPDDRPAEGPRASAGQPDDHRGP